MRKVIAAIACAGLASAAAAEVSEVKLTPGAIVEKRLSVQPGKFVEVCAALKSTQAVAWKFRADGSTDFNIHYHVDKQVEYPEKRVDVSAADGHLTAGVDQIYCWMWSNRSHTPVVLDVHLSAARR